MMGGGNPATVTSFFSVLSGIFKIIGSLGMFLYGMKVMSTGIQKSAGEGLQKILNIMTTNRITAVLTGFLITAIIQSSSATTVMVVGFANAGLLTLTQSIGVIMGANIGTTVTGWIVAILGFKFSISAIALPAVGFGLPFMISKRLNRREFGEILIGFGLLFIGLEFLKDSVPDIRSNPDVLAFLSKFSGPGLGRYFLFVLVGTAVTIIVQSSSAAMAITIAMAYNGWIDFNTAAAIVLGENIGTTITAYIASLGTDVNARRAARAHTLFNILGVFWMSFVFPVFLKMINGMIPGDVFGPDSGRLIPQHLALFHTMFNLINTFIFIFFVKYFAKLVELLVPDRGTSVSGRYRLKYISTGLQETAELNVVNAKHELAKMARIIENMYESFLHIYHNPDKKLGAEVEELKNQEEYTDQMQEELSAFLASCARENLTRKSLANVTSMIRIIDELESIGDSIFNLIILVEKRFRKKIELDTGGLEELEPYLEEVRRFIDFTQNHLNEKISEEELNEAIKLENSINTQRNHLKKAAQKRLQHGSNVRGELLYLDIVKHIERIGDFALNIAEALQQMK